MSLKRPLRAACALAAFAGALLAPGLGFGQASLGTPLLPESIVYVAGGYDLGLTQDFSAFSGRAGVRLGEKSAHVLGIGFSRSSVNQNGSSAYTYSFKYAIEGIGETDGTGGSGAITLGLSRGYSWLFNVEGEHLNGRLTSTNLPVGLGLGYGLRLGEVLLTPYLLPQFTFVSRKLVLYDRKDEVEINGTDYFFAGSLGLTASFFEHAFVGLELYSQLTNLDELSGSLSVGGFF